MLKQLTLITMFFVSISLSAQIVWSEWKTTNCYKGLDFRVKKGEYREDSKVYKWHIEFRNRYKENIHFSFGASGTKNSDKTSERLHVKSNGGTRKTWALINASNIYVYVNKVIINEKDDWSLDYYNCDK